MTRNQRIKYGKKIAAFVTGAVATVQVGIANAASQLPAGVFTNLQADATDTVTAVVTAVVPVGVTVAIIWSAVTWAKRGTKAATK
jgi:hypothetical protein